MRLAQHNHLQHRRQRAFIDFVRPHAGCLGCGQRDCLQNLASVPAILAQLSGLTGEPLDFRAVLDRPEPIYADAIRSAALRLGYALADVVRVLDPERVVVGGQLARAGAELVLEPIRAATGVDAALVPADEVYASVVKGGLALGRAVATRGEPADAGAVSARP